MKIVRVDVEDGKGSIEVAVADLIQAERLNLFVSEAHAAFHSPYTSKQDNSPEAQQGRAWQRIVATLDEYAPGWGNTGSPPVDAATDYLRIAIKQARNHS